MDFSGALVNIKIGAKLQRAGWNGKGMWIALCKPGPSRMHYTPDASDVDMTLPYIYMKTADGNIVPWLASQTDILAEDWTVWED